VAGSAAQRGEGLVAGAVDRNREPEAGDLEYAADLVVVAADDDPSLALALGGAVELLPGPDDQGDPGRVDELALGEVDDDRGVPRSDGVFERPLEFGGGTEVELATDCDDANSVIELRGRCLERRRIHAPMLPQARSFAERRFAPGCRGRFLSGGDGKI
jgi:hypothetical protein